MRDLLDAVEAWYAHHCDGDWEHQFGIQIRTLDNPGWAVDISLTGTALEDRPFEPVLVDSADDDWVHCRVRGNVFEGRCSPRHLGTVLRQFLDWASPDQV